MTTELEELIEPGDRLTVGVASYILLGFEQDIGGRPVARFKRPGVGTLQARHTANDAHGEHWSLFDRRRLVGRFVVRDGKASPFRVEEDELLA